MAPKAAEKKPAEKKPAAEKAPAEKKPKAEKKLPKDASATDKKKKKNKKSVETYKIYFLGQLKYFLGIEIVNTDSGVCLCQRKYTLELLHEYGMLGCKPANTPIDLPCRISNYGENENDSLL